MPFKLKRKPIPHQSVELCEQFSWKLVSDITKSRNIYLSLILSASLKKPVFQRIDFGLDYSSFAYFGFFQLLSKYSQSNFAALNILFRSTFRTTCCTFSYFTACMRFVNRTDQPIVGPYLCNEFTSRFWVCFFYFFVWLYGLTYGLWTYAVVVVAMVHDIHIILGIFGTNCNICDTNSSTLFLWELIEVQIGSVMINECSNFKLPTPSAVYRLLCHVSSEIIRIAFKIRQIKIWVVFHLLQCATLNFLVKIFISVDRVSNGPPLAVPIAFYCHHSLVVWPN